MDHPSFMPESTQTGWLPPWQMALAFAFHTVLEEASAQLGVPAHELVGQPVAEYIAKQVYVKGGGHPTPRTVQAVVARCKSPEWYPGKPPSMKDKSGRPPVYTEHQKEEVARVGMSLKRKRIAPTPRRVRARLPHVTRNPDSGEPMDKQTIHGIFRTRCYDDDDDPEDTWVYQQSPAQDMLPSEVKPLRVACAGHILRTTNAKSWHSHVAIDPCYHLLPKTLDRQQELQVYAMGSRKWMSPKSARTGINLRAPATAKTQGGSPVTRVDWTPIFARGKVRLYVCDRAAAQSNPDLPSSLADSRSLAKFVKNVLPHELQCMKKKYGWADVPRVVVHDKASYMVAWSHQRLNAVFADALKGAGFTSWVGGKTAPTDWLVRKFGDVYPHETVNAHVRRLLDQEFTCSRLSETPAQFRVRMQKAEDHMNSSAFAKKGGGQGLLGLAKELRARCKWVVQNQGERVPK